MNVSRRMEEFPRECAECSGTVCSSGYLSRRAVSHRGMGEAARLHRGVFRWRAIDQRTAAFPGRNR
ncbi:MAG: hypothetical protein V8S72_01125 [Oscillospiraceae bacterium]